jgi:hypothetical protein
MIRQADRSAAIAAYIEEKYLDLGPTREIQVQNALLAREDQIDYESPVYEILSTMKNPDYFPYTCKHLLNVDLLPFQAWILKELWRRKFPMLIATRGGSKTWLLALYALLRLIFTQNSKIVVVGAAFRQSKLIFEYLEDFWRKAPILRNMVGTGVHEGPKRDIDRCTFYIGDSECIAIPIGDGTKIRGLRAHYTLCDEFASIPQEVYEVVVKGFGSVSASPSERVQEFAAIEGMKELGMKEEAEQRAEEVGFGNQSVITGTAYYSFNYFYDYWLRYKHIIESKGDERKLQEIFQGNVPEDFNWKDYSVFRIPYTSLPKGFMDETQIAQAKATFHSSNYQMEYAAVFATDSNGFIKRSLIESCVTKVPITLASGPVKFSAMTQGRKNARYVYGIDPASEDDNFSIVVLELHSDHRRIVYCWSANRQTLREKMKKGERINKTFYNYCARKIRDLMKIFPTEHIVMDAQGGGVHIMEALHDKDQMEPAELFLWPWIKQGDDDVFWWEVKDKPTDAEAGLHCILLCQFAKADFTYEANHGVKKDFETKALLFPEFDSVTQEMALSRDKLTNRVYDTLEDCVLEIEQLKDEISTIVHNQTPSGRDRWDTPEVKLPGNKKGRLRKDRYSALLLANIVARCMENQLQGRRYEFAGGYAGQKKGNTAGKMYSGPEHIVQKMQGAHYGVGLVRR